MERFQLIQQICRKTDDILWNAFKRSQNGISSVDNKGNIIFPEYRNGNLRVSEQEARFAFVESLNSSEFLYAVEVPTEKTYSFEGKSPLSAQTDLVIYESTSKPFCNVEFKAKGISPKIKNDTPVQKDLIKLLREPHWGLWFHLFEAVDNSTIENLLKVMTNAFKNIYENFTDIDSPGITIHIHVLKQGFSLHKNLPQINKLEKLENELSIDLKVTREKLDEVNNVNGWDLYSRDK